VAVNCEAVDLRLRAAAEQLPPGTLAMLEFPAQGESQDLLVGPSSCTFNETPPPGCELAGINPPTVQILQPNVFQVLVINDCEPPAPPSNVNIQGTIVVNQPPTPVVVATPRFTG
jgi:hypothetical protein